MFGWWIFITMLAVLALVAWGTWDAKRPIFPKHEQQGYSIDRGPHSLAADATRCLSNYRDKVEKSGEEFGTEVGHFVLVYIESENGHGWNWQVRGKLNPDFLVTMQEALVQVGLDIVPKDAPADTVEDSKYVQ